jgi:hypothetical protein
MRLDRRGAERASGAVLLGEFRSSQSPAASACGKLPLPSLFEDATAWAGEDDVGESVVCGRDPDRHAAAVREFVDAGYDHVYLDQVGSDQNGFLRFAERELLPALEDVRAR